MKKNSAIKTFANRYIDQELLSLAALSIDPTMYKMGGPTSPTMFEQIVGAARNYFSNHWDEKRPIWSAVNLIAPEAVLFILKGSPLGWIISIAMSMFHIDLGSIFESIFKTLKPDVEKGKAPTEDQIRAAATSAVETHTQDQSKVDDFYAFDAQSFDKKIRKIRILKLATLNSTAQKFPFNLFSFKGILIALCVTIFVTLIGDIFAKIAGLRSGLDQNVAVPQEQTAAPTAQPTQTKFKVKGSYNPNENKNTTVAWAESIPNTPESISNMLVMFAKDVYDGLGNLDSVIESTPAFQTVKNNFVFYNHRAGSNPPVLIPEDYKSRKQIVDQFIDEVAEAAK